MTYTQALEKKICPNCSKKLYNIVQETDGERVIIKFMHRYLDFCEDIIDLEAFKDPNNLHYFKYIQALYQVIKPIGIKHYAEVN